MEATQSTHQGRKDKGCGLDKTSLRTRPPLRERLLPGDLRGRFLVVLLGVLLPSLTLFGILHHDSVKRSLLSEVDLTLDSRANEISQVLETFGLNSSSNFRNSDNLSRALLLTSAPEVYVTIFDGDQKLLWASRDLTEISIPLDNSDLNSTRSLVTVTQADGSRLRRLVVPLDLDGDTRVYLVLAESLRHLEAALKGSIGRTVILGLLVLALTEVAANQAFRGVFHPLHNLVDTAEMIVATGDVTRRVPVAQDSDPEIQRTAVAFNHLMDRVEEILTMAKRLLADTSHELRNPLTVLVTDLDLLREELTSDQRKEVITDAQHTVKKMTRLVSDLLLLSRTDAKAMEISTEEVDLVNFIERVVERFNRSIDKASVIFSKPSDKLITTVLLNRERTDQILTNLFENGIRYSDGQDLEVKVLEEKQHLILAVKDSGPGIAPEEHAKIFQRFYRVDRSRGRHSGGTGLGLPVAQAIARLQGGDITVLSRLDQGAEFRVSFLRAPGDS